MSVAFWLGIAFVFLVYFVAEAVALLENGDPNWPPAMYKEEPFSGFAARCKMNSTVTDEQVRRFVYTPTMFDDDQSFKCYVFCTWQIAGAVQPNGKLNQTVLFNTIESLTSEQKLIILNMGKLCLAQKGKDLCNRIYGIIRCMKTTDFEHFFFF